MVSKIEIGMHVKVPIYDTDGVEKLWFKVMYIEDDKFIGRCSNEPIGIAFLEYGQDIELNVNQIIEIRN